MPWFDWNCLDEAMGIPYQNREPQWEDTVKPNLSCRKTDEMKKAHSEGAKRMWESDEYRAKQVAASAKTHRFINPEGELVEIFNLQKFCKDNGLTRSGFINLKAGRIQKGNYKGWTNV